MLVLSRKLGESIMIGDDVRITILHVGGGRVRLGVQAPAHVTVHREEVRAKMEQGASVYKTTTLAVH